ncbi:hypothetical protein Slin15195_G069320 [Septoria linicola]|uniref:Uncharacterized protein n=1 Tax=Septoria linicola TaxID=215465 RepID=A0A9Q9ELN3_9PEZI|nr:hypothetical protein Slin14017_G102060 [Septoria linicola]USW53613.1 hypothetical protein Slin15195_G069320 [Septoria linicola]
MADKATKTATDATSNPAGAAGALTGGDSALGGVAGGRRPAGPANRPDEEGVTPTEKEDKPSSLQIRIKLDLDVEIHLTARVKGDITIGLL